MLISFLVFLYFYELPNRLETAQEKQDKFGKPSSETEASG